MAEIDTAVGEMLDSAIGATGADDAAVMTAEEERILSSGGLDVSPLREGEEEPLTETALQFARLLQSSLNVEQAARLLGVNESRIRQRLTGQPRTLYGVKEGKSWRLPRFQFTGKKLVPGLDVVLAALPRDLHPVAVHGWLTTPHPDLTVDADEERTVTPLDWLKTGRPPEVVADLGRDL